MNSKNIKTLHHAIIPTIVSFDLEKQQYVIGDTARRMGIAGKTNAFGFKELLGRPDSEYEKPNRYWLAPTGKSDQYTKTLSSREVVFTFLSELLRDIQEPAKLIFGIPPIEDDVWLGHYKRHIRDIMKELKRPPPDFFYEPFAIYHFYKSQYGAVGGPTPSQTYLMIDVGGSTFNSLIVKTTKEGYLPMSGAASRPIGVQAGFCGGQSFDHLLLARLIEKAKQMGHKWKEDPLERARSIAGACIFPLVEDAKISLSNSLPRPELLNTSYKTTSYEVTFPAKTLHPSDEIRLSLNGDDLKEAVDQIWTKTWKNVLFSTIQKANAKLASTQQKLDRFDKVFVAGGCSRLPFFREELWRCAKQYIDNVDDIIISEDPGYAVAEGIALEVREQSRRSPELTSLTLGPCLLSDLYIAFRQARTSSWEPPKTVRVDERSNNIGKIISSPMETVEGLLKIVITLPFSPSGRLFYGFFSDGPDSENRAPINISQDVFRLPPGGNINRQIELHLNINGDGEITPTFVVTNRQLTRRKEPQEISVPAITLEEIVVDQGKVFVGVDFGNSNSYVTRLLEIGSTTPDFSFPRFEYTPQIRNRLKNLEVRVSKLREANILSTESVLAQACTQTLNAVFHSNKIEGVKLSIGETEEAMSAGRTSNQTPDQFAALNLQEAYEWTLENCSLYRSQPEMFVRSINQMLLRDIHEKGGQYRDGQVKISGYDWSPPPPSSVAPLMSDLGRELQGGSKDRSMLEFAATIHTKLVTIHPFFDGNGRCARLLLDAILVDHAWPPIIVRVEDRPRYMEALAASNKGNIGPLITLFIELCNSELDDLERSVALKTDDKAEIESENLEAVALVAAPGSEVKTKAIDIDFEQAEDPLAEVLKIRRDLEKNLIRESYECWAGFWLNLLTEVKNFAKEIGHAPQYSEGGIHAKVHDFGLLSFDSYCDMRHGQQFKETWFFTLNVESKQRKETFLFSFGKDEGASKSERREVPSSISLFIARLMNGTYNRLSTEPLLLRGFRVVDGRVRAFSMKAFWRKST